MNSGRCVRGRRDGGRSVGPRAVSVRYRCGIGVTARFGRQSARADWDEPSLCNSIYCQYFGIIGIFSLAPLLIERICAVRGTT